MALVSVKRNGVELFKAELANTPEKRVKGLMFSKTVKTPLLFEFYHSGDAENGIHSLFCPEFDAVFLTEGKKIARVFERVRPFSFFITPGAVVKYLLELEPGSAARLELKEGVELGFDLARE